MPVYAKLVKASNARFRGRIITIASRDEYEAEVNVIPVPDGVVLCNGCNENVAEGYLIYLGKKELQQDSPYDIYCSSCLSKYFPKTIKVEE